MSRSPLRMLVLAVTTALGALLLAPSATAAAAPSCAVTWGSGVKSGTADPGTDTVRDVRAGTHACYDRLVVDLANARGFKAYRVAYGTAHQQGSGAPMSLRGAADIEIVLESHAYDRNGRPTFAPRNKSEVVGLAGFRTFRQLKWGGSHEGQTTLGLGVRARLPMRVTVLPGAPGYVNGVRVVIDVAHAW